MKEKLELPENCVLRVEDLTVEFTSEAGTLKAVNNVSFDLQRGRTLALVGESGSGKSVTCYSLLRLIQNPGKITGGRILFRNKRGDVVDIVQLNEKDPELYTIRGGQISMIFQEPMTALSPVHTVGNQICEAILLHQPLTKKEAEKKSIEMLGRVGIPMPEQRIKQYPFELSGGMRQRVVIAMALVCRPEILLADEPTTALDVTTQAQILELINELKDAMGTSVIFVTHDLGVVAQVADEVVVMHQSRVMETAPVGPIYENPFHSYTRGLFAAMPRLDQEMSRFSDVSEVVEDINVLPENTREFRTGDRFIKEPYLYSLEAGRKVLVHAEGGEL